MLLFGPGRKIYGCNLSVPAKAFGWLMEEYNLDVSDVKRHYDAGGKLCPLYYVEHPEAWDAFRADVAAAMEEDS